MEIFKSFRKPIRSVEDLARGLGLRPAARQKDIASAFAVATGCDAALVFEEKEICVRSTERWEVRVIRDRPRCRVHLRHDPRGSWITDISLVPKEVRSFFMLIEARGGHIETRRKWRRWERGKWMWGSGRRFKSKSGTMMAAVDIPNVSRTTGETSRHLIIEPLCIDDDGRDHAVELRFPVFPSRIMEIMDEMSSRAMSEVAG